MGKVDGKAGGNDREALSVAQLYHIAEARGRRRHSLKQAVVWGESRDSLGCACRKTKQGCCDSCEGCGAMTLFEALGGDRMHEPKGYGCGCFGKSDLCWDRFVRVDQETGFDKTERVHVDDGWGDMSSLGSLNQMLKQMSAPEAEVLLPEHPDTQLWREIVESRAAREAAQKAWQEAERAAGRDGLNRLERWERDLAERQKSRPLGCEHCSSRYCWRGARCPENPDVRMT